MALLDLKSNLSKWRKPTSVEAAEKQKLTESPVKAVYSTSNELKPPTDIKINKVDNSTSIQVPGAKKIDYKLFSINSKRGRNIPAISKFFGDNILDKISSFKKQTPDNLDKISSFKKQTPDNLDKISSFIKITPRGIQHISSVEIIKTILREKLSIYKQIFPISIEKLSLYKQRLPIDILKLSLYKDQIPAIINKLSLYIDQLPKALNKLSLYKGQLPKVLSKLSLYKQFKIDNKNSIYDSREEIIRLLKNPINIQIYANKFTPVRNGFNDLTSGAKGFIINQKEQETAFLGISNGKYTYPKTVREGRLKDITKIAGAKQNATVIFSNRLNSTKYNRTLYSITKPYVTSTGINGDTLEKYFYRTNSPSAHDILYSAFNLRDNSFNTGLALFNQPLILSGIQRKDFVKTGFRFWETWKFDDGLIRGGVVTSTQRAIVDVLRLGKWFASVKGLLFVARQAGLQASAPNTEADPLVGRRAGNGALTVVSALANTVTQHTGIRFRKDSIPFVPRSTYSRVQTVNKIAEIVNPILTRNRLIGLYNGTWTLSRLGGPQSVYGIGTTDIRRVVNSKDDLKYSNQSGVDVEIKGNKYKFDNKYKFPLEIEDIKKYYKELSLKLEGSSLAGKGTVAKSIPNGIFNFNNSGTSKTAIKNKSTDSGVPQQYYTLGYNDIRISAKVSNLNSTEISNFLLNGSSDVENAKWIPTQGAFLGSTIQDYKVSSQHIRTKLQVPDYGKRGKNLQDPLKGDFMKVYTPGGNGMIDPIWKINQTDKEIDDFVKFMFHDLNTNERFRFRAYIENVSEDFNPEWQQVKILGRADSPYIYQGFERTVSISFKAAALSRGDLMLMWDQLERLAKTTVPQYQTDAKMKGPLIKFTLGNWFINTPAFIKSLSYTVDNETPWEINLSDSGVYEGNNKEYNVGELPMIVSVQVSMQIFGEVRPETAHIQKTNITDIKHYNRGNLYPLGAAGLRANRQRTVGNDDDNSEAQEFLESIRFTPPTEPTADDLNSVVDPALST